MMNIQELLPGFSDYVLEIGSGKGRFLCELARRHPQNGYIGLEIQEKRAEKCRKKVREARLNNVRILSVSMEIFFENLKSSESFQSIHLNFPDPWPKKKHARRRLIHPQRLLLYYEQLKDFGNLIFVTDDPTYAWEGQYYFRKGPWKDVFGGLRCHWPSYPVTIHEEKFRRQGREIYYQKYAKGSE
jgi:tRNA (guanine-N7-)-methyltransferase